MWPKDTEGRLKTREIGDLGDLGVFFKPPIEKTLLQNMKPCSKGICFAGDVFLTFYTIENIESHHGKPALVGIQYSSSLESELLEHKSNLAHFRVPQKTLAFFDFR